MELKKKIIYYILLSLFIIIIYKYYYYYIDIILHNNCKSILGGYYKSNGFLIEFIQLYKVGEYHYCNGYYSLFEKAKFTLPIYILLLWLTIIPFIIYIFKLKEKYIFLKYNIFYVLGLFIIILMIIFSYLSINTSIDPYFEIGLPMH